MTVREILLEFRSKSCYNSNIDFDKCLSEEVLILSIVKTTLCKHLNDFLPMGNLNMQKTYVKICLSSLVNMTISKYYNRYMEWVYYLEGMKEKKERALTTR